MSSSKKVTKWIITDAVRQESLSYLLPLVGFF
jgi:hypothetical protein